MISCGYEEVGNFVGEAIASPLMQFGTLVTVVAYVATTQPYLGLLMVAVVVPQAAIVLVMQKRINDRISSRIKVMRKATGQIAAEDLKTIEQAVLDDFDKFTKRAAASSSSSCRQSSCSTPSPVWGRPGSCCSVACWQ
jgi:hypothetical protein